MGIRTAVAALGIVLASGFGVSAGAGAAGAIDPLSSPEKGLYFGVALDSGETVALSNSPIPVVLDRIVGDSAIFLISSGGGEFDSYYLSFPVSDVIAQVAARGGHFGIAWVDAAQNYGRSFRLVAVLP
ncbi:hypothetical protein H0264_05560 [Nocardia huaxiensis]|uniref:Uncharacterized protein n=1 Tax=Nocardia huaxiensis TaxID=2755382 RepID=A0A7D6ZKG6_9NOCA|nr:hypothetical protein [Nocardia huaxiensis]QLY31780.1 hypothetical protein H0264_05560 [Nocardia huaxiensis]